MTRVNRRMTKSTPGRTEPIEFTVLGEPASKANSRRLVSRVSKAGRTVVLPIKSEKALSYAEQFARQCPALEELFTGDVIVMFEIYYGSRRPDLDESLILDLMQGRIYVNDRQVKARFSVWGLDPGNPRTVVRVAPMEGSDLSGDIRRNVWELLLPQRSA